MTEQITTEKLIEEMAKIVYGIKGLSKDRHVIAAIRRLNQLGFAIVPRVPSEKMLLAGIYHKNMGDMEGRYIAMINEGEIKL